LQEQISTALCVGRKLAGIRPGSSLLDLSQPYPASRKLNILLLLLCTTKKRSSSFEATPVDPDPQKGSKSRSTSLLEATMARRTRRRDLPPLLAHNRVSLAPASQDNGRIIPHRAGAQCCVRHKTCRLSGREARAPHGSQRHAQCKDGALEQVGTKPRPAYPSRIRFSGRSIILTMSCSTSTTVSK